MLKIRQARELQKFDFARKLLRMLKRFPAARRALCAASGGVADRLCLFQKLLRQKPIRQALSTRMKLPNAPGDSRRSI